MLGAHARGVVTGSHDPSSPRRTGLPAYSTVTALARFRGWSTSSPLITAMW